MAAEEEELKEVVGDRRRTAGKSGPGKCGVSGSSGSGEEEEEEEDDVVVVVRNFLLTGGRSGLGGFGLGPDWELVFCCILVKICLNR